MLLHWIYRYGLILHRLMRSAAITACRHQDSLSWYYLDNGLASFAFDFNFLDSIDFLLCSLKSSLSSPFTMIFTKIAVLAHSMCVLWSIKVWAPIWKLFTTTSMVTVLASPFRIELTINVRTFCYYPALGSLCCLFWLLRLSWFSNNWLLTGSSWRFCLIIWISRHSQVMRSWLVLHE